jgi:hypothetical protein
MAVLAILGCRLQEMALPYAVLVSAAAPLAASWACRTPNSLAGFLIPSAGIFILWGLGGIAAGLMIASWAVLWFGLGRLAGSDRRWGAILGTAMLLCLFSVFYARSLGPHGGFWLWFSLYSCPLPALWGVVGDVSHYFGAVSTLLYNRWYGNDFQVALPAWWVLSIAYLVAGTVLTALAGKDRAAAIEDVNVVTHAL